jgi:hypothetical protein
LRKKIPRRSTRGYLAGTPASGARFLPKKARTLPGSVKKAVYSFSVLISIFCTPS